MLQPVPGLQEVLEQPGFGCPRSRGVAVFPADQRGQAHEDGFGAPAGFDAEPGAAILQQVELDVAAAPVELPVALPGGPWPAR